jgi:hypothetical protein
MIRIVKFWRSFVWKGLFCDVAFTLILSMLHMLLSWVLVAIAPLL